jgi:ATP-dependent Clp protease ATP-binding subunit ClpA
MLLLDVTKLLDEKNISVNYTEWLKKYLSKVGYDKDYWARPLKRTITNTIINQLSLNIISDELKPEDNIILDIDKNNNLVITKKS